MNRTDKARIIERAHTLAAMRVPFVHQGRSLSGIDCVGGLAWIFEYTEDDIPSYPRDPVNGELERELEARLGPPIMEFNKLNPLSNPLVLKPCDIVSMQYAGPIRHVGVVVPHLSIPRVLSLVHTDSQVGRTTEHIIDGKWLRRIMKVWRP